MRKAYYSVVAPATPALGREASAGLLVTVRRQVSIKVTDRTPRKNHLVRFSGFISPSYPLGPGAVATLQRRDKTGGFANVKAALLKTAGQYTSYRVRVRVKVPGVYRIAVPASTYFGSGASVAIVVRESFSLIGDKALLTGCLFVLLGPVLVHTTARSIRARERGDWRAGIEREREPR